MGAACRLYHDDGAPLHEALPNILAAPAPGPSTTAGAANAACA
ncbi:oxidoreductase [Bordetella pertussis]|nr:oxidoreductase [Bordetella pertussis]